MGLKDRCSKRNKIVYDPEIASSDSVLGGAALKKRFLFPGM